jgi:hypothetical protein
MLAIIISLSKAENPYSLPKEENIESVPNATT